MTKRILAVCFLAALLSLTGCYTREDIETIRANAWESGYQEGLRNATPDDIDTAFYDNYDFGYRTGWDEALYEYHITDHGSDTQIGKGFRDGWVDALYEYDITP